MTKKLESRTDLVPDPFNPGHVITPTLAMIHPGQRFEHSLREQQRGMAEGRLVGNGETIEAAAADRADLMAGVASAMSDRSGE